MNVQINRSQLKLAAMALAVAILAAWAPAPAVCQQPIPAAMRRAVTAKLEAAASAAGISIDPAKVSIRTSGSSVIAVAFRPEREPFTSSELAKGEGRNHLRGRRKGFRRCRYRAPFAQTSLHL